jgi:HlyD family secretion protein
MSRTRLAGGLLLAGLLATACTSDPTPPPTAVVDRGTVSQAVSASGSLVSVTQQNLGFADGGQVAELLVKVGDTVAAGQPLARLDDAAARSQLASAQAKLDQQDATLGKVSGANTVESAQAAVVSARNVLSATREQVDATNSANESAVERARLRLDFDRRQLDKAKQQLAAAKAACSASTATPAPQPLLSMSSTSTSTTTTTSECQQVTTAEQTVTSAKSTVLSDETALIQAENTRDTGYASGRLSIANAESQVSTAEQQLNGASNDAPADVAVQDAVVADAQNTVADAQRALDNTVLRAPVAGTVSAINGAVGDFLTAAGGASALAPGSDARIPEPVGTTATATTAAAGPFITLNDLATYQLVVPFEESDAAKVAANQPVDVTVDAVPGVTLPGTVVAVAPTADQLSGVVSYYATVLLNQTDPALKDGQTAQADVRTETRENVLRVPAAAVRQEGGKSVVSIPGPDGNAQTREFTPGLVGDQYTEVQSGLDEGQQILLPSATVAASPQGPAGPR